MNYLDNKIIYIPHPEFKKSATNWVVKEPTDVDFGRARTFNGFKKKMIQAGYNAITVTLIFPDGSDMLSTAFVK